MNYLSLLPYEHFSHFYETCDALLCYLQIIIYKHLFVDNQIVGDINYSIKQFCGTKVKRTGQLGNNVASPSGGDIWPTTHPCSKMSAMFIRQLSLNNFLPDRNNYWPRLYAPG